MTAASNLLFKTSLLIIRPAALFIICCIAWFAMILHWLHPAQEQSDSMHQVMADTSSMSVSVLEDLSVKKISYYSDKPRNLTSIDIDAPTWDKVLSKNKVNVTPHDAMWMPILGTNISNCQGGYVYSAFLETRLKKPFVLVLGYIPRNLTKLACRFHYDWLKGGMADGGIVVETEDIEPQQVAVNLERIPKAMMMHHSWCLHPPDKMKPFIETRKMWEVFIRCPLPSWEDLIEVDSRLAGEDSTTSTIISDDFIPSSVSIRTASSASNIMPAGNNLYVHRKQPRRKNPKMHRATVTFCAKNLRNVFSDVTRLVEFIELHAILAGKGTQFHIYGHSYSQEIGCILDHYVNRRIRNRSSEQDMQVHFHNYEFYAFEKGSPYQSVGIDVLPVTTMNDCLYRSIMDGVDFVVNMDFDETLVPNLAKIGSNLGAIFKDLLAQHPKAGSFEFHRYQFPLETEDDKTISTCGLRVLRKVTKLPNFPNCLKVAAVANRVIGMDFHYVFGFSDGDFENVLVDPALLNIHHYSNASISSLLEQFSELGLLAAKQEPDKSVQAYAWELKKRMRQLLEDTQGMCGIAQIVDEECLMQR